MKMTRGERREAQRKQFAAQKRAMFSDQREIGRFTLSPTKAIVARLLRKNGEPQADVRTFITRGERETATRMGVMMPLAALPELRELVEKLIEAAEDPASTE